MSSDQSSGNSPSRRDDEVSSEEFNQAIIVLAETYPEIWNRNWNSPINDELKLRKLLGQLANRMTTPPLKIDKRDLTDYGISENRETIKVLKTVYQKLTELKAGTLSIEELNTKVRECFKPLEILAGEKIFPNREIIGTVREVLLLTQNFDPAQPDAPKILPFKKPDSFEK